MEKGTFRGGDHIGLITYDHLPASIQEALRRTRMSPPAFTNVRTVLGTGTLGPLPAAMGVKWLTEPGRELADRKMGALLLGVGVLAGVAYPLLSRALLRKVKRSQAFVGALVASERTHPLINGFIEAGATHVAVSDLGNLHFYKAPESKGKTFKPAFRARRRAIQ